MQTILYYWSHIKLTKQLTLNFPYQPFSARRSSYHIIRDFQPYFHKIRRFLSFKIVFLAESCPKCDQQDCYVEGKYCALNVIHQDNISGRQVLDEQMRASSVWRLEQPKWWEYMKNFDRECSVINEWKECSKQVMTGLEIDYHKLDGFIAGTIDYNRDYSLLKEDIKGLNNSGITIFPSVTINNQKVKGRLTGEFIFDDICNTLLEIPLECLPYVQEPGILIQARHSWLLIFCVILGGLILFGTLFCLYRRLMRRRMASQMQGRVDDMVAKYIEFYSERRGANA